MDYLLGVDAGNTKTIALVADLAGNIVGAGRSGCGDIYGVSNKYEAFANVRQAVDQAMSDLKGSLLHACYCMAGADWEDDYNFLRHELKTFQPNINIPLSLYNDGLGALRAGSPTGLGVAVVVGTYVATAARSEKGFWHSSFWQEPSGARCLAKDTLRAVYRAELGVTPTTQLRERILELYQLPDVEALLYNQTSLNAKAVQVHEGQITRALLDSADEGDEVAKEILEHHATLLSNTALVAIRNAELAPPFPVVFSGGVFKHPSPFLREAIVRRLKKHHKDIEVISSQREPVLGALLLAFETTKNLSEETLERLEASLPPASFFET
jgi:N-acetylglucosamine kinase-like BadF-type ATPase